MTRQEIELDWSGFFLTYHGNKLWISNICDENNEPQMPRGDYYIVETDNTNSYGYHIDGKSRIDIQPVAAIDGRGNPKSLRGHARTLAKCTVRNGYAYIVPHEKTIRCGEGF